MNRAIQDFYINQSLNRKFPNHNTLHSYNHTRNANFKLTLTLTFQTSKPSITMPVSQYTQDLPTVIASPLHDFLAISPETQATWPADFQARYTQFCNAIKGECSPRLNWTLAEWRAIPAEVVHFLEEFCSIGLEIAKYRKTWTEEEYRAFRALCDRVPRPQPTEWWAQAKREMEEEEARKANTQVFRTRYGAWIVTREPASYRFLTGGELEKAGYGFGDDFEEMECECCHFREERSKWLWAKVKRAFFSRR